MRTLALLRPALSMLILLSVLTGLVYPLGMTGLAQVRGLRGATLRRSDLSDRLKADLEYLDGWTIGRDVLIAFRTLGVMIHRNAY